MLWWLIVLWFLPPLLFLAVFLIDLITGIGGGHSKLIQIDSKAGCSRALNVTDTSAATHDPACRQRGVGHTDTD